jgi:hypothetical protein
MAKLWQEMHYSKLAVCMADQGKVLWISSCISTDRPMAKLLQCEWITDVRYCSCQVT